MGLLSDFFIADKSTTPRYDGGKRFHAKDRCQYRDITPLQAAQFLAVLRRRKYTVKMIDEFQLLTPEDAEQWTMAVPGDMVEKLAKTDDSKIPDIARRFAEATSEELGWSPDDFVPIVTELAALARRANEQDKAMYLWNCL